MSFKCYELRVTGCRVKRMRNSDFGLPWCDLSNAVDAVDILE